jgi:hypothetical protein
MGGVAYNGYSLSTSRGSRKGCRSRAATSVTFSARWEVPWVWSA